MAKNPWEKIPSRPSRSPDTYYMKKRHKNECIENQGAVGVGFVEWFQWNIDQTFAYKFHN